MESIDLDLDYVRSPKVTSGREKKEPISVGSSYASFGEILQGALCEDNSDFLVTLPVSLSSRAVFRGDKKMSRIVVYPSYKTKAQAAIDAFSQINNIPYGGVLTLRSEIPIGKGLSSSTADIVAALRSVSDHYLTSCKPELLEQILSRLEPSDGVMYDNSVAFYHKRAKLMKELGRLPPLTLLAIDGGGNVDTLEFNKKKDSYCESEKQEFQSLLSELEQGIRRGDLATIGAVSTRSAEINQRILYSRILDFAKGIAEQIQSPGVVMTHSGTMVGIMLDLADNEYTEKFFYALSLLKDFKDSLHIFDNLTLQR